MAERKPNNYASQVLMIIYCAGTISGSGWGDDWSWSRAWRAMIWPAYIAWVEVDDYIINHIPPETAP